MRRFTETGIAKALDPSGGLGFFHRFRNRVLGYFIVLSFASSVVAGGIYYSRQVKFVEGEQRKRGRTLISNLAGQSELGAYSEDNTFLFVPVRRSFQESDVSFAAIYNREGIQLIKMTKPGVTPRIKLPEDVLRGFVADPSSRPVLIRAADHIDLLAPIVSVSEDPEEGLFGATGQHLPSVTIGVAHLGLSRDPAEKKLDEVLRWGIFLSLIILTMGGLIGLLLARRISQPVMDLARGADEVRRGNLGHQLFLNRSDELGLMAESFNRMSSKLRETVESLAHLNRTLEQEVSSRTADLQRSRDFIALLNAPLQLDNLLDSALSALVEHTRSLAGAIFFHRAGLLELVVCQGAPPGAFETADGDAPRFLRTIARRGRTVALEAIPDDYPLLAALPEIRVLLCAPVIFRDSREAVLLLALDRAVSEELTDFTDHASSELGIAVANARAFDAMERLARELEKKNIALMQQRDQLQEVNRLKSEFLANISHELRTPLNAIIGYTELIADGIYGEVNETQGESLSGIADSAGDLLTLINHILDLSKVEAGRMKVARVEVDVGQIVRDVISLSAPLVKDRPYLLTARLPDQPLRIRSDPSLIKQILVNLVSNAIKFTREGSVEISAANMGGALQIQVADTGLGIPSEHLNMIFDEFRQVDGSSTRTHGGTGLGLAICKKLSALLNGEITVESAEGRGSTFTVLLRQAKVTGRDDRPREKTGEIDASGK